MGFNSGFKGLNGVCSVSVRKGHVAVRLKKKQKGTVIGWWAKKWKELFEKLPRNDAFNLRALVS